MGAMSPEALLAFLKQFDERTLKALSVAASAVGIAVKLVAMTQGWAKERAADRRRTKSLQYAGELATILEKVEQLDCHNAPEVRKVRSALLQEIDSVGDKVLATYPPVPDNSVLTVPERSPWRRRLLLYWPQRKLALVPQLLFYYLGFCTAVAPLWMMDDPEFQGWNSLFVVVPCLALILLFRAWAVAAEYTGRARTRSVWERASLLYLPQRPMGLLAHAVYWILAFSCCVMTVTFLAGSDKFDTDAAAGMTVLLFGMLATQQFARLYDGPPAVILPNVPPQADPSPVAKAANA